MKHLLLLAVLYLLAACAPPPPHVITPTALATPLTPLRNPETEDRWLDLLQKDPYPFTAPLPNPITTPIDGFYAKVEPKEGTPVPCKRCPDYLPEGGIWKLQLTQGAFRIFHEYTGWRSLGSFALEGDELTLFNDPTCPRITGRYRWRTQDGWLAFQVIEDDCQVNRRARTFANMLWTPCQPPHSEAAVSDHWQKPAACEDPS